MEVGPVKGVAPVMALGTVPMLGTFQGHPDIDTGSMVHDFRERDMLDAFLLLLGIFLSDI